LTSPFQNLLSKLMCCHLVGENVASTVRFVISSGRQFLIYSTFAVLLCYRRTKLHTMETPSGLVTRR